MASAALKKLDKLQARVSAKINSGSTVVGIVSKEGNLLRSLCQKNGKWVETDREPTAFVADKLEPLFTRPKRFTILIGGRGSGKSLAVGDYVLIDMHDNGANWFCLREYQNSIEASVHQLLSDEVNRIELDGFNTTKNIIGCSSGAEAHFTGIARNPDSVKSAFGFKGFWIEEAHNISKNSLETLTPTARNKPVKGLPDNMVEVGEDNDLDSVTMVFTANPASSEDPFSQRFIVPFKDELDKCGIYEDDLHLVIKMNWSDNPWFSLSGLDGERMFDFENKSRAEYDHIWEGEFNDHIENALILPEWFDACINAHEKLGFKARGIKKVTHDPSDLGNDPKAIALRHGNVILDVVENTELDVNEGSDWATDYAVQNNVDQYEWDVGGMGLSLKRQVNQALEGKKIDVYQFNGGSSVDNPDGIYQPSAAVNIQKQKTNKETFRNLRAQCYFSLRDRVYLTYRAVMHNEPSDPELYISFSKDIQHLGKLRSELCRMPVKPNGSGLFELYTKEQMRKQFKLSSPNLADCVMMSEHKHVKMRNNAPVRFTKIKSHWG